MQGLEASGEGLLLLEGHGLPLSDYFGDDLCLSHLGVLVLVLVVLLATVLTVGSSENFGTAFTQHQLNLTQLLAHFGGKNQ